MVPPPQGSEHKRRYVPTPDELNSQPRFVSADSDEIDEADLYPEAAHAEASLHSEIKEIESGVSDKQRERIHKEIHEDNVYRLRNNPPIGEDLDHIDAQVEKRKIEKQEESDRTRELELRFELMRLMKEQTPAKTPTGLLAEWDSLTPKEKEPFLQAPNVKRLLDFLTGRAVIQKKFGGNNSEKKEE